LPGTRIFQSRLRLLGAALLFVGLRFVGFFLRLGVLGWRLLNWVGCSNPRAGGYANI